MKTHIRRLSEFYPYKENGLSIIHDLTKALPMNRLSRKSGKGGFNTMETKHILIVDDEAKIREHYKRLLISKGFDVATAYNAIDAQYLLIRHSYDLVLLDINMAGVDGAVLYDILRTFHKDTKVIVSSVYPIDEQKERITHANGYFDKSDDRSVLVSLVQSLTSKV